MSKILVRKQRVQDPQQFVQACPFGAIETDTQGRLLINEQCRLCLLCLKFGDGVFSLEEDSKPIKVEDGCENIAVYLEWQHGKIHPVSWQLVCKAKEMADRLGQQVLGVLIGADMKKHEEELQQVALDVVEIFDQEELREYRIEPYTAAMLQFVRSRKPNILLIGATPLGRSLAPRVAVACRTGLTADCTGLEILPKGDLVQIRPAFGGNIMAQIKTPYGRPQMATVRPHVIPFTPLSCRSNPKIMYRKLQNKELASGIEVITSVLKPPAVDLADAEVILAVGRGLKRKEDVVKLVQPIAERLSAVIAYSRPLIEAGWAEGSFQIGLSGRSIRPKLLITIGISGTVQFSAGIQGAEYIVAINSDPEAPIFNLAHLGLVGDCYEILPYLESMLASAIKKERSE